MIANINPTINTPKVFFKTKEDKATVDDLFFLVGGGDTGIDIEYERTDNNYKSPEDSDEIQTLFSVIPTTGQASVLDSVMESPEANCKSLQIMSKLAKKTYFETNFVLPFKLKGKVTISLESLQVNGYSVSIEKIKVKETKPGDPKKIPKVEKEKFIRKTMKTLSIETSVDEYIRIGDNKIDINKSELSIDIEKRDIKQAKGTFKTDTKKDVFFVTPFKIEIPEDKLFILNSFKISYKVETESESITSDLEKNARIASGYITHKSTAVLLPNRNSPYLFKAMQLIQEQYKIKAPYALCKESTDFSYIDAVAQLALHRMYDPCGLFSATTEKNIIPLFSTGVDANYPIERIPSFFYAKKEIQVTATKYFRGDDGTLSTEEIEDQTVKDEPMNITDKFSVAIAHKCSLEKDKDDVQTVWVVKIGEKKGFPLVSARVLYNSKSLNLFKPENSIFNISAQRFMDLCYIAAKGLGALQIGQFLMGAIFNVYTRGLSSMMSFTLVMSYELAVIMYNYYDTLVGDGVETDSRNSIKKYRWDLEDLKTRLTKELPKEKLYKFVKGTSKELEIMYDHYRNILNPNVFTLFANFIFSRPFIHDFFYPYHNNTPIDILDKVNDENEVMELTNELLSAGVLQLLTLAGVNFYSLSTLVANKTVSNFFIDERTTVINRDGTLLGIDVQGISTKEALIDKLDERIAEVKKIDKNKALIVLLEKTKAFVSKLDILYVRYFVDAIGRKASIASPYGDAVILFSDGKGKTSSGLMNPWVMSDFTDENGELDGVEIKHGHSYHPLPLSEVPLKMETSSLNVSYLVRKD